MSRSTLVSVFLAFIIALSIIIGAIVGINIIVNPRYMAPRLDKDTIEGKLVGVDESGLVILTEKGNLKLPFSPFTAVQVGTELKDEVKIEFFAGKPMDALVENG